MGLQKRQKDSGGDKDTMIAAVPNEYLQHSTMTHSGSATVHPPPHQHRAGSVPTKRKCGRDVPSVLFFFSIALGVHTILSTIQLHIYAGGFDSENSTSNSLPPVHEYALSKKITLTNGTVTSATTNKFKTPKPISTKQEAHSSPDPIALDKNDHDRVLLASSTKNKFETLKPTSTKQKVHSSPDPIALDKNDQDRVLLASATENEFETLKLTSTKQEVQSSLDPIALVKNDHDSVLRSLQELARSPAPGSIVCSSPHLTPIYDRILYSNSEHTGDETAATTIRVNRKIPRIVHFSFNQRCVPNELAESIDRWKKALPDHSVFFHDDNAVQRLIEGDDRHNRSPLWHSSSEHFPELRNNMRCIKFKGAMLIDLWRILVSWTYGGIYTDIDNWPGPKFDARTTIREGDSFFSLSDTRDRPSQWLFGMTPRHPIALFTLQEISRRLLKMRDIARPRVVRITGPQALKVAFRKFTELLEHNATIFGDSFYYTQVQKIDFKHSSGYGRGSLGGTFENIVDRFYDESSNTTYFNITKREKIERVGGIIHWTETVKGRNVSTFTGKVSTNWTETETGAGLKYDDSSYTDNDHRSVSYDGVSCIDYLAALDDLDRRKNEQGVLK